MTPKSETVATALEEEVGVGKVNRRTPPALCRGLDIPEYPTFLSIAGGRRRPHAYAKGKGRTPEALVHFARDPRFPGNALPLCDRPILSVRPPFLSYSENKDAAPYRHVRAPPNGSTLPKKTRSKQNLLFSESNPLVPPLFFCVSGATACAGLVSRVNPPTCARACAAKQSPGERRLIV